MKTKMIIISKMLLSVVFMVTLAFGGQSKAENTLGTVWLNVWTNSQTKTLTMELSWSENDQFIKPMFYWDTIPDGLYRDSLKMGAWFGQTGQVNHVINYISCKDYFIKCRFIDGKTNNEYTLTTWVKTQGDKAPEIRELEFSNMGYTFAEISLNVDGHCNGFDLKVEVTEQGKLPYLLYNESYNSEDGVKIKKYLYALESNKHYELNITVSSWIGMNNRRAGFQTLSNLPPTIEGISETINTNGVLLKVYADPKNTSSLWRIELGKDIFLPESTQWYQAKYSPEDFVAFVTGREPNTIYFWRPFIKNEHGTGTDKTRLFKTNGDLTAVTELTWSDLLQVSNSTTGIHITLEKPANLQIYSIDGSLLHSEECYKETSVELNPGIYIVEMNMQGKVIKKKAIVF